MITPSTSSTLTTEAIPAPSALDGARGRASGSASLVAVRERPRPHAARQACAIALPHQLEQVGLATLLLAETAHVRFHRRPAGIHLHAAAPPARAARPVDLHHDVPDLAGAPAPGPRLTVEDQAPTDAGPPEHAQQRAVQPAGPQFELGVGGDLDVVAHRNLAAESARERCPSGNVPSQPGRLRALLTLPASIVPEIRPPPLPASQAPPLRPWRRRAARSPSPPRRPPDRRSWAWPGGPSRARCDRRRRSQPRSGPTEVDPAVGGHPTG